MSAVTRPSDLALTLTDQMYAMRRKSLPAVCRIGFAPLKTTATPEQVGVLLRRFIRKEGLELVGTTEGTNQASKKIKAIRKELGSEYTVQRQGEYINIWKRSSFRSYRAREYHRLTKNWWLFSSWRDWYVGVWYLEHIATGQRVRVEWGHGPATIESGKVYANPGNDKDRAKSIKTHKDGLTAWGKRLNNRLASIAIIAGADFNTNFKHESWRKVVESNLGLQLCWSKVESLIGSHGGRLIDALLTNLEILDAYVSDMKEPDVFDHEQVVMEVDMNKIVTGRRPA